MNLIARVASLHLQATLERQAVKVRTLQNMMNLPGDFGILSAYGPGSKSDNQARHGQLIRDLQMLGYRRFETLRGQWEGVAEKSVLVPRMKFQDLIALGNKYQQISVVHKNSSGALVLYYLKEHAAEVAVTVSNNPNFEIEKGKALWSKGRGNSFSFNFLWGQRVPWDGHTPISRLDIQGFIDQGVLQPA